MRRAWALIAGAIAFEVCGTTCLKLSEGFTVLPPSIAVVVLYLASFTLFTYALAEMPLGLAYGIWGGVGTMLTTIVGIFVFDDPFTALTGLGLVLIVAGVALMSKGDEEAQAAARNAT